MVGIAVRCRRANKEAFYEMLCAKTAATAPVTEGRLGVASVQKHMADPPSKLVGADGIINPNYGVIQGPETMSEHELLLQLSTDALADAGSPSTERCGIVSGCLSFPRDGMQHVLMELYEHHVESKMGDLEAMQKTKGNAWLGDDKSGLSPAEHAEHTAIDPASFVARRLGLSDGSPRICLDAACASAIYCMKLAQDYLTSGTADMMLCGASCFPEPMFVLSGFSAFKALPGVNSGLPSAPFERETAGLTPGEGGAIFVLKRLADAERDGDRIYGTLLGAHVTNGGKGQPLKPDMPTELQCLEETYAKFGVEAKSLQYVECHATGTPQGDAVELGACARSSAPRSTSSTPRRSTQDRLDEGNFGHTLVAAGFAGATKVLLSMNKGVIPATPENAADDAARPRRNCPWPDCSNNGGLKRAGLSASASARRTPTPSSRSGRRRRTASPRPAPRAASRCRWRRSRSSGWRRASASSRT